MVDRTFQVQDNILKDLIYQGKSTISVVIMISRPSKTTTTLRKNIPIRDYEDLKPYIQHVLEAKPNVLWKGKPEYLAKTSGTTSGTKYYPHHKRSVSNHNQ
jgi:hypothetical protein